MPRDKEGENWVEKWGWVAASLFTTVQKDAKDAPLTWGESGLPFDVEATVCNADDSSLWPCLPTTGAHPLTPSSPLGWPSAESSDCRKRFIWRSGRWWPSHPPRNLSLPTGRGPSALFFKGLKDNSKSVSSFVFKITNIITTERCCDLFQGQSQDSN